MKIRGIVLSAFLASTLSVLLLVWLGLQQMLVSQSAAYIIIWITLGANIMGACIGYLLLNPTVRSLQKLNQQVKVIAEQQFTPVTSIQSPKELHSLSLNINYMVSELSTAFTALSESEQEKTHLIASLGHDLKTPLTALQSQLEALQDHMVSPDELELFYQQMANQVTRMSMLTQQLMEVALIESTELERITSVKYSVTDIKLDQFLVNLLSAVQPQCIKRQQLLDVEVPPNLTAFRSDESALQRILANLLDNASKYSPKESRILLSVQTTPHQIIFTVTDQGLGISEADLPFIFNRLYRVDHSRNSQTGGSGLGLYISKTLSEQLGGTLSVTSRIGEGSQFELRLLR